MRITRRDCSAFAAAAVLLAAAERAFGAESFAWGPAVNGLRLGARFGADPLKPTLRIAVQNLGSGFRDVVIGHDAGGRIYDSLRFVATAKDGKQQELVHRSLYTAIAGLVLPFSAGLNAGETYELELPLKDILYASRTTVTLDALLKQGCSLRVRFEATKADASWAGLVNAWIGRLESESVAQPF